MNDSKTSPEPLGQVTQNSSALQVQHLTRTHARTHTRTHARTHARTRTRTCRYCVDQKMAQHSTAVVDADSAAAKIAVLATRQRHAHTPAQRHTAVVSVPVVSLVLQSLLLLLLLQQGDGATVSAAVSGESKRSDESLDFDVVVYGGTSGGIAAAIAASRHSGTRPIRVSATMACHVTRRCSRTLLCDLAGNVTRLGRPCLVACVVYRSAFTLGVSMPTLSLVPFA
jgi:hypothetical protein